MHDRKREARAEAARATVAVLAGGRSSEREISLATGAAIVEALSESCADERGPARCIPVSIEADGAWTVAGERSDPGAALARLPAETIFFLGLHGGEGENGSVQGFLETSTRRYTGSGVGASALCMDKRAARLVAADAGIRVAPACLVDPAAWGRAPGEALERAAGLSREGWAVKPNAGGSSVATTMVESVEDLPAAIGRALATGDAALVERRIPGIEATCAVLGNAGGELRALTPVEIVPHAGRFFDWEQKYDASGAQEHCPPRTLEAGICERLRELSLRAHRALGCDGYSRADFIVPPGGTEPVLLEVNTLPGMTSRSLLPKAARTDGLSFRDLCLLILDLAVERFPA